MKRLFRLCIFLLFLGIKTQGVYANNIDRGGFTDITVKTNPAYTIGDNEGTFDNAAKKNKLSYRKFNTIKGLKNGYYIIAGVFGNKKNAKRSIKRLKRKGFDSNLIHIDEEGINYVYLQYHKNWKKAINACASKFNGTYKEPIWIMDVHNALHANRNNITRPIKTTNKIIHVPTDTKTVVHRNAALVKKADVYFEKMWYAEAAEIYEHILAHGEEFFTSRLIQKAGDSHYFNTNMERAYHWYSILFEKYNDVMSSDNIFKYAHSLKGTGKYTRSKRLMRLYNKTKKEEVLSTRKTRNDRMTDEKVLDNILNNPQEVEIKNLAINTQYSDFSPMFLDSNKVVFSSAKDSSFFTTRRYKWNNQPYLDLYVAKLNEESTDLKDAVKFSKNINTKYHEASVTFSPNNDVMYFTRNNYGKKLKRDKKGINNLKIYRSVKIGDEWSKAVEVPFNSDEYSTGHPALSPDGKKLYFVSDMPGSIGQTDIFVVDVYENNTYSEPKNLGPEINTEKREMFPFVSTEKLYFSSNGRIGLGGLDVYESSYTEEGGFQEAINLGKPINSKKDDFSYVVDKDNYKGFFASNRAKGKGDDDIYSFKRMVPEEAPENLNAIAGVVTELITGDIMPKSFVELLDENGIKLKELTTQDDGSFVFEDLEGGTKYTLKTTKNNYLDETIEIATIDNEKVNVDVAMKRLKEKIVVENGIKKLKTEMIHFDFDKSYIRNDAREELDKLVEIMTEYPEMVIKIESHTDSRGKRAYNKYLSDKRAKSTRDYIVSRGIDSERIQSAIGYGEDRLLNECTGNIRCTEKRHFVNRRSEFVIVNM